MILIVPPGTDPLRYRVLREGAQQIQKTPHQQSNFVILLKLVILSLFSGLVVFHCFMSQSEAHEILHSAGLTRESVALLITSVFLLIHENQYFLDCARTQ